MSGEKRCSHFSLTKDTFRYLWRVLIQTLKGLWLSVALQGSPSSHLRVPPASGDRNQMPETRLLINFARFRSKTEFLMKFLDDSAWFCVKKSNKHCFSLNSGDRIQMPEMRLWSNFMFRVQNLPFEVISYSFGIMFRPENSRARQNYKISLSGCQERYFS